jgi:transposase
MLALLHIADLPDDVTAIQAVALEQNRIARQLWEQLDILKHQVAQFARARFGASSEQLPGQAELFVDTVTLPVPPPAPDTPVAGHVRRGRPALPKDLPRERIEYDLTEAEKAEFDRLERIGEEVSETLDYTPAKLTVIEHVRIKYACRKDGESTIRTAFAQPSPLPKSNASAGLLAQIGVSTFVDHMPLNRQEAVYKRHGIVLPRATLCDWKLGMAELLEVLLPPLKKHILKAPRLHSDDTTMPLQEPGRGSTKTARLWGYLGAGQRQENGLWIDHPPAVLFEFTESREAIHPLTFLADYEGYLQVDAYSGYLALCRTGRVIPVGCWAHCRRRFFEIAKVQKTPGLAAQALAWIARLYAIEATIKDLSPDQKHDIRQSQAVPLLTDLRSWLEGHFPKLLPQSPLAQAFGYALRNWESLMRYTENGVLDPDNNAMERAIRPIAVGRSNYLFAGSSRGGRAAATMYSLLGTAKLNGLNPYIWLKDALTRLPSHPSNRVDELLPLAWPSRV